MVVLSALTVLSWLLLLLPRAVTAEPSVLVNEALPVRLNSSCRSKAVSARSAAKCILKSCWISSHVGGFRVDAEEAPLTVLPLLVLLLLLILLLLLLLLSGMDTSACSFKRRPASVSSAVRSFSNP